MAKIRVQCPRCIHCGESSVLEVEESQWQRRQAGELVQRAFPDMAPADREMLITGTHPACWEAIFKGPDAEDDDLSDDAETVQESHG
jgi:hypothetical protein